ncbi:hypothetical protein Fuma_06076 [Fuerstiella marisgermanici]|uniref:Uncharacterized protein n=1 Tax=Fuerstiella marisgermanici TaxID=1891926 RepID=A0A1P8WQS1_9PLAN|nr:hypothetical protein Fuma_06076 [Fuerstiella marisgermanici]
MEGIRVADDARQACLKFSPTCYGASGPTSITVGLMRLYVAFCNPTTAGTVSVQFAMSAFKRPSVRRGDSTTFEDNSGRPRYLLDERMSIDA